MPITFPTDPISFNFRPGSNPDNPPPSERGPVRTPPVAVRVPSGMTQPYVVLTGFLVKFTNDRSLPNAGDHHFGELEIRLAAQRRDATTVMVRATIGLRDWSHEWDDPFDGSIRYIVVT